MKNKLAILICTTTSVFASPLLAANLVPNGDFSAGNSGFSSDYTYSATDLYPAATYTVGDNPNSYHGLFVTAGDHTTGSGLMLIANGSSDIDDVVWQSNAIAIEAATNYFFEAFLMNVYPSSPPLLSFTVSLDGAPEVVLATLGTPVGTGVWNGLSTSFNSGTATSVSLFLRNAQSAYGGNDFALDDVYLGTQSIVAPPTAVPEPATWAMLVLGFGLIGGSLRRRPAVKLDFVA